MGRARSAVAVRTTVETLVEQLLSAFSGSKVESESFDDFYDALDYCRNHSEEFSGDEGTEAWYVWRVADWTIVGDLSMRLCQGTDELETLSNAVGEVVAAGVDTSFQYAAFSLYNGGEMKRLLVLEDDEIIEEGFPTEAERGRQLDDFDEEEAERLWTSYGLPTFEYDPADSPFLCIALKTH